MRAVAVAFLFNVNVVLYFVAGQTLHQNGTPLSPRHISQFNHGTNSLNRVRRDSSRLEHHVIDFETECMLVTSDEGHFYYKSSTDRSDVCGIYMITDPDKRIEVIFTFLDVPCENGGLVSWIDGWELNRSFFPSPRDHPRPDDQRYAEYCDARRVKKVLVSSQNAAMLQYRIPTRGKGFSVSVRHVKNPTPCNILLFATNDVVTLRNYGKRSNCSLSAIFSASVRALAVNVGVTATNARTRREMETGTVYGCHKRGLTDYVDIGGSTGLDSENLQRLENVCGMDSIPGKHPLNIICEVTTVRMVSSGQFDNSATIEMKMLDLEDEPTFACSV